MVTRMIVMVTLWSVMAISCLLPTTIQLESPKSAILECEPLNIVARFHSDVESQPHLQLFINGKLIDQTVDGKGWKAEILPRDVQWFKKDDQYIAEHMLMLFAIPNREDDVYLLLFDKAGRYKIKVADSKNGIESNVVEVEVKALGEKEKEARKLFMGSKQSTSAICRIGKGSTNGAGYCLDLDDETLANFEKVVKDYPDTPFAPYASHILGMRKDCTLPSKPWKEISAEIKEIIPYFLPALKIERSRIQEEALFYIRRCYVALNENIISEEEDNYYKQLLEKYPFGKYAETAKTSRKVKEDLINERKQEKK